MRGRRPELVRVQFHQDSSDATGDPGKHKVADELDLTVGTIDLEKIETLTTEELEAARTWHRKLLGRE